MDPIHNISDTALWVAIFRAEESERPDAVFNDPFARRLAGQKGEQIANAISFMRKNSGTLVARTWIIDELIKQHVAEGYDMIVNLAAGLDTRPYRMQLPANLQWIEVDLPGMIDYKQNMLANEQPVCDLQRISLDLSDREARQELFTNINAAHKKALVLTEGLLIYLTEQQNAELATDLAAQQSFKRWAFDLISPGLLTMLNKEMGAWLKDTTAFKFGPQQGEAFFTPYGWKPIESRSQFKTAAALNRLPEEYQAMAAIPEPEGTKGEFPWSGICLLERTTKLQAS
jgi:methyltransferase (TIGR00027 family)